MLQNIFKEKKNIVLFLSVLILFGLTLTGCGWFSEGIFNVFDPKAAIRVNLLGVNYSDGEGTIDLEIYSYNQVEFKGAGFKYTYYNEGELILSKTVGWPFNVEPSSSPGTQGPITVINELPLYYQDIKTYMTSNPLVTEVTCTITLIGTDGARHDHIEPVIINLPLDFFPDINIIVSATPASFESNGGISTITAYVVDPVGRPVTGLNVIFTTTGGTLSSSIATTNTSGLAKVTLTVPINTTDKDVTYDIKAYVGSKEGSTSITVYKSPELVETGGSCPE